jgi:hypothetical protein
MGFFDGGAKVLSFGEVDSPEAAAAFNVWRGGVIVNVGEARQQSDIDTRQLKFWPNSQDPVMQLPITLDTAAGRAPERLETAEDDGVRDLYITKGKQMYQAARAALRKANADDFHVGGSLYIRWVSGKGKRGDARQFELFYEAPAQSSNGFMNDATPPAAAPSMPPQQPPAPQFDPQTGQPLAPPAAAAPRFDPNTGQPLAPPATPAAAPGPRFDPTTGAPMNDAARAVLGQTAAGPPAQGGVVNPYAR